MATNIKILAKRIQDENEDLKQEIEILKKENTKLDKKKQKYNENDFFIPEWFFDYINKNFYFEFDEKINDPDNSTAIALYSEKYTDDETGILKDKEYISATMEKVKNGWIVKKE